MLELSPDSDHVDFDTHLFIVLDDDDDEIMDEQFRNVGTIDPYWSHTNMSVDLELQWNGSQMRVRNM